MVTVFLRLKSGPYRGVGSWGRAATTPGSVGTGEKCREAIKTARKIARQELRRGFGATPREATEIIEWQVLTKDGWALVEDISR